MSLRLHNVSFRFINECARGNLALIPESWKPLVLLWDVEELPFVDKTYFHKMFGKN